MKWDKGNYEPKFKRNVRGNTKKIGELISNEIHQVVDMQKKIQYQIDLDIAADMPEELIQLETLEKDGGFCLICGKDWQRIEVKNILADFFYYDPECKCYPRCPECKTSLHREAAVMGTVRKCSTCGHLLIKEDRKLKQITEYSKSDVK